MTDTNTHTPMIADVMVGIDFIDGMVAAYGPFGDRFFPVRSIYAVDLDPDGQIMIAHGRGLVTTIVLDGDDDGDKTAALYLELRDAMAEVAP